MPNRNYIRGRAKEYRVREKLRKEGARWTARSASSKGPWDVFAMLPEGDGYVIRFVQCKPRGYRLTRAERKAYDEFAAACARVTRVEFTME